MTNIHSFGNIIKEKRLASNLRMDDVAKMAGITRATLWSIEKGNGNCSMNALFKVLDVLELSFSIDGFDKDKRIRKKRASRTHGLFCSRGTQQAHRPSCSECRFQNL